MPEKKFLDSAGLSRVWSKIKAIIPTKTSDLENDSGYMTDLSNDFKEALLACIANVAWSSGDGQQLYDNLYYSLYDDFWDVTNTLSNCTTSNSSTKIPKDTSYSAVITPDTGYTLNDASIYVEMGGVDITNTAYANGTITIGQVTGDVSIVISALGSIVWDYTDGDNGVVATSVSTTSGSSKPSATFASDGLVLTSGTSTAWAWAQAWIVLPNGVSLAGKKTTVEVEYSSVASPAANSSVNVFSGSPETTTRIYTQTSSGHLITKVVGGTGGANNFVDISSTWGTFGTFGTIKVTYDPSTDTASFYKNGTLMYTMTTDIYNYDHSYGAGIIAETQRGGSVASAATVKITHIRLTWMG